MDWEQQIKTRGNRYERFRQYGRKRIADNKRVK